MSTIRVIVFEPGKPCTVREIDNDLAPMQAVVGGYIEQVKMRFSAGVLNVICNEDGIEKQLPQNRWNLLGTFFVARSEGEEFVSLTANDVLSVMASANASQEI